MKRTGFLYDERYQDHKTGSFHPEVPERLAAVHKGISDAGLLPQLSLISACRAEMQWIEMVHDISYVQRFEAACRAKQSTFDNPDNKMSSQTYDVALLAVGGILETVRMVMEGKLDNAFCAVRPPGHHAESDKAMGFCYFNNVAISARFLQKEYGISRVGIVDFDVHHGNGTQNIFDQDPTVFYYSIHQHPSFAYPGTGREFEHGNSIGQGFTKNSPVLPGHGDDEYKRLMEKDLFPAFEEFKPEVILVSTGFDGHKKDDMSDMKLSTEGFSWIMRTIVALADRYSKGRLISVLEGGYCLQQLPELAKNHVEILLGIQI